MSGNEKLNPPSRDGQDSSYSSTKADATLHIDSLHSESRATSVSNRKLIDSAASPAQGEQNADLSSSDLDARLDRVLKYYHGIAIAAEKNRMSETHTNTAADATRDRTRAHSQKSLTPAHNSQMSNNVTSLARTQTRRGKTTHNEMRNNVTSLARTRTRRGKTTQNYSSTQEADTRLDGSRADSEQSSTPANNHKISEDGSITSLMRRARELNARLKQVLAQSLEGATPVHMPPPASMAYTREEVLTKDQSACPIFRLPPELRNAIYTYVFHSKYSLPQFQWDEEHDSPKLSLKCAQPRAPPNELLRTCRSIYKESKGIFVEAKTQFWSDTTFTLTLPLVPRHNSFGYLDCLLDEQVNHTTRINIHIDDPTPFTVHLRSGSEADSSVTCRAPSSACNHRTRLPDPLSFIERVDAIEKVQGQLSYRGVVEILWFGSRGPGSRWMHLCGECAKKPVVISVPNLSRAGLVAAVVWACDGPKCRTGG